MLWTQIGSLKLQTGARIGFDSKLLSTNNAGAAWQIISLPGKQINYADFISPLTGWISIQDNGGIYYTTNGGSSWTQKNNSAVNPFYGGGKMRFLNDSTGYAVGSSYTIYKSTDTGKTWEPLPRDNSYSYLAFTHNDI